MARPAIMDTPEWRDQVYGPGEELHVLGPELPDNMLCPNPKCGYTLTPEDERNVEHDDGMFYCPNCHGNYQLFDPQEYAPGGVTRSNLTLHQVGNIGEQIIAEMGEIPGLGRVTEDLSHLGKSGQSTDMGAPDFIVAGHDGIFYAVEVKSNDARAQERFKMGGFVERQKKYAWAVERGYKPILVGVRLNFFNDQAQVFVQPHGFKDTWYGSKNLQHVATVSFADKNPFKQPGAAPPAGDAWEEPSTTTFAKTAVNFQPNEFWQGVWNREPFTDDPGPEYDNPSAPTHTVYGVWVPTEVLTDPHLVDIVRSPEGMEDFRRGQGDLAPFSRTPEKVEELQRSITEEGLREPITINVYREKEIGSTMTPARIIIIDGTHRVYAMANAGWPAIPVAEIRYMGNAQHEYEVPTVPDPRGTTIASTKSAPRSVPTQRLSVTVTHPQDELRVRDTKGKQMATIRRCANCGHTYWEKERRVLECPTCGRDTRARAAHVKIVLAGPSVDQIAREFGWEFAGHTKKGERVYQWTDENGIRHKVQVGSGAHGKGAQEIDAQKGRARMRNCMKGNCLHGPSEELGIEEGVPEAPVLQAGQQVTYGGKRWWVAEIAGGLVAIYDPWGKEDVVPIDQLRMAAELPPYDAMPDAGPAFAVGDRVMQVYPGQDTEHGRIPASTTYGEIEKLFDPLFGSWRFQVRWDEREFEDGRKVNLAERGFNRTMQNDQSVQKVAPDTLPPEWTAKTAAPAVLDPATDLGSIEHLDWEPDLTPDQGWHSGVRSSEQLKADLRLGPHEEMQSHSPPGLTWEQARNWLLEKADRIDSYSREKNLPVDETSIANQLRALAPETPFNYVVNETNNIGAKQNKGWWAEWYVEQMPAGYRNSKTAAQVVEEQPTLDYKGTFGGAPKRLSIYDEAAAQSAHPHFKDRPGLVAFIDYFMHANNTIYVGFMSTEPSQRGQGYARQLIQELYDRYPDKRIVWGKIMDDAIQHLKGDFWKRYPERTARTGPMWHQGMLYGSLAFLVDPETKAVYVGEPDQDHADLFGAVTGTHYSQDPRFEDWWQGDLGYEIDPSTRKVTDMNVNEWVFKNEGPEAKRQAMDILDRFMHQSGWAAFEQDPRTASERPSEASGGADSAKTAQDMDESARDSERLSMGLRGDLPPQLHVEHENKGNLQGTYISAWLLDDQTGNRAQIGGMTLEPSGMIAGIEVEPDWQRRGVADAMYFHAMEHGLPIYHDWDNMTAAGEAWARRLDPDEAEAHDEWQREFDEWWSEEGYGRRNPEYTSFPTFYEWQSQRYGSDESDEREPTHRWAYYRGKLVVEKWHHNDSFKELLERLLAEHGHGDLDLQEDVSLDEAAGGLIYPGGEVEHEHLAPEDVQERANEALREWRSSTESWSPDVHEVEWRHAAE